MWGSRYEFFEDGSRKDLKGEFEQRGGKDREMRKGRRGMLEAGAVSAEKARLLAHVRLPLGKQLLDISNFIS